MGVASAADNVAGSGSLTAAQRTKMFAQNNPVVATAGGAAVVGGSVAFLQDPSGAINGFLKALGLPDLGTTMVICCCSSSCLLMFGGGIYYMTKVKK